MTDPYVPDTFVDGAEGGTPISAAKLNKIENAIDALWDEKQAADDDLTAIAGLSPQDGSFLARQGGTWAGRTSPQTRSDIGAAAAVHTHPVNDLAVTGTASSATFLRGDGAWSTVPGSVAPPEATSSVEGVLTLSGDLGGTAISPLVTRRAPIGGVQAPTYASTLTPNAGNGNHVRITATGDMTISAPTGGVDGQRFLLEVTGSGLDVTITFNSAIETSQAVPGRVFTVPNATWGYFALILRGSTWRLLSAEPQTAITVPTLPVTSQWLPADHGLLAWTSDPAAVNSTVNVTSGWLLGSTLKLDAAATVSNVICLITTAGATFSANTSYAGIYSTTTGSLLGQTADQAAVWNSTGLKIMPLTSSLSLAVGSYFVATISTATTQPVYAAPAMYSALSNLGRTTTAYRAQYTSTVYTALPSTRPAATGALNGPFFGLS